MATTDRTPPGSNNIANIATTSTGEPARIASVSRLRRSTSMLRRTSTAHSANGVMRGRGHHGGQVQIIHCGGSRPDPLGAHARRESLVDLGVAGHTEVHERLLGSPYEREATPRRQEHDPVTVLEVFGAVRGENHGRPLLGEVAQRAHERNRRRRIETRRRLVEEDGSRSSQELGGNARPLALTTAQRSHPHTGTLPRARDCEGRR